MKDTIKNEIENLIKKLNLNCSIAKFSDKVNWYYISKCQKLSEGFVKEVDLKIDENNQLYKDVNFKESKLINVVYIKKSENIARLVHNSNKIRVTKFLVKN